MLRLVVQAVPWSSLESGDVARRRAKGWTARPARYSARHLDNRTARRIAIDGDRTVECRRYSVAARRIQGVCLCQRCQSCFGSCVRTSDLLLSDADNLAGRPTIQAPPELPRPKDQQRASRRQTHLARKLGRSLVRRSSRGRRWIPDMDSKTAIQLSHTKSQAETGTPCDRRLH
jgi:hypothetical protein